jgi:energy-coupling factor transporter ATP-binding protein EcfA2
MHPHTLRMENDSETPSSSAGDRAVAIAALLALAAAVLFGDEPQSALPPQPAVAESSRTQN